MLIAPPIEKHLKNEEYLEEIITDLSTELEDAEEEGSNIHIVDSAKFKCKIFPYGNIDQATRSGYNLIKVIDITGTKNGLEYTAKNGVVIVNGTPTVDTYLYEMFEYVDYEIGDYFISGCPVNGSIATYVFSIDNIPNSSELGAGRQISLTEAQSRRAMITIKSGVTVSNLVFKPMVTSGTEKKSFEQYGVMPSLEFPSEVKHVGGSFESYNKFTLGQAETTGISITNIYNDSEVILNGTSANEGNVFAKRDDISHVGYRFIGDFPAGTYKFTSKLVSGNVAGLTGTVGFALYIRKSDKTTLSILSSNFNHTTDIVLTEETKLYVQCYCNSAGITFNNCVIQFQVTEGTEEKPYLPYGEVESVYDIANVNKNLFDKNNVVNGSFVSSGIVSNASWCYDVLENFEVGETYIISGGRGIISFFNGDTNISYLDISNDKFTIPENITKVYISTLLTNLDVFQLEKGSTATDYTPHQSQNYLLDLTNYPLYSENDYIYDNKVHNEFRKVKASDLSWAMNTIIIEGVTYSQFYATSDFEAQPYIQNSIGKIYSNTFLTSRTVNNKGNHMYINKARQLVCVAPKNANGEYITTLDDWNTAIEDTYFIGKLAERTETSITDETVISQLEALLNSSTYKGITNITTEKNTQEFADLKLKIEYKKSNQIKINELEQEIESLKALILEA